jgi:hypothetical protein
VIPKRPNTRPQLHAGNLALNLPGLSRMCTSQTPRAVPTEAGATEKMTAAAGKVRPFVQGTGSRSISNQLEFAFQSGPPA